MQPLPLDYVWPLLGAATAGGLIGFEREYHGRAAGLRTHILVALAPALLMLAAVHQLWWMGTTPHDVIRIDPTRMAHGVLTGIGFLCGGVIFREGLNVHGLTTAASLWITSALGTLFGVGFYGLAVGGTLAVLVVLAGLRQFEDRLPRTAIVDVLVRYRRGETFPEAEFQAFFAGLKLKPSAITHRLIDGGEAIEISATVKGRGPVATAAIAERLCADPRIVGFEIAPRHE